MSPLTHAMRTASAMLRKDQPPFWVRTTWLFAELELLRQPDEAEAFDAMKVARLSNDITALARPLGEIDENTKQLESSRARHERTQLVSWIRDHIERETNRDR